MNLVNSLGTTVMFVKVLAGIVAFPVVLAAHNAKNFVGDMASNVASVV